jgi:hypothetical protein
MNEKVELIFLVIIGVVLLLPFVLSRRRTHNETNLKPIYEDRAFIIRTLGPFISGSNIPYWRLSFYDKFMIITAGLAPRRIEYNQITNIGYKKFFFSKTLYLEYRTEDGKHSMYIYPRNREKILSLLTAKIDRG